MLQPHDFDAKEKSKHKFMVQSMIAVGNTENLENIVRKWPFLLHSCSNNRDLTPRCLRRGKSHYSRVLCRKPAFRALEGAISSPV